MMITVSLKPRSCKWAHFLACQRQCQLCPCVLTSISTPTSDNKRLLLCRLHLAQFSVFIFLSLYLPIGGCRLCPATACSPRFPEHAMHSSPRTVRHVHSFPHSEKSETFSSFVSEFRCRLAGGAAPGQTTWVLHVLPCAWIC